MRDAALGAGVTAVMTDELHQRADLLRSLVHTVFALRTRLAAVDRYVTMWGLDIVDAPLGAAQAELDMDQLDLVLIQIEVAARGMAFALNAAADGYGFVERLIGTGVIGISVPSGLIGLSETSGGR